MNKFTFYYFPTFVTPYMILEAFCFQGFYYLKKNTFRNMYNSCNAHILKC